MTLALAVILAFGAFSFGMAKARTKPRSEAQRRELEARIRAEAARQGVPAHVALATAWVESRMNPDAEGDLRWHENVDRYRAKVPASNPYASLPKLWHSYGLFQLLAPYHVQANESPLVLLDPQINIERGVKHLARLLDASNDLDEVRLRYVGGMKLSPEKQAPILHEWRNALQRYLNEEYLS